MHRPQHQPNLFAAGANAPAVDPPWVLDGGFLDPGSADALFAELLTSIDWQTEQIWMFGRHVTVPRLVSWQGERGLNYRYSGRDHRSDGFSSSVLRLRDSLADAFDQPFNFVLLNRYRDGSDYMGWHSDDEAGVLGGIASVSLGAERRFSVRRRPKGEAAHTALSHGSALYMPDGFQSIYAHQLPRTRKILGERINLTFRWLGG